MIKNYLKIAFRSLIRNRRYTLINIFGLAFGMACVILISLYIMDELTFDAFHENPDQVFRVIETKQSADSEQQLATVSFKLSRDAAKSIPEVEETLMLTEMGRMVIKNEETQASFYQDFLLAEPSIFKIFGYELEKGDPSRALTQPNTTVISQELSRKLFGDQNPIGKTVTTDRDLEFTVDGVLGPIPANTHLQFDALFSFSTLRSFDFYERVQTTDWTSNFWLTYLKLNKQADPNAVAQKLTALVTPNFTDEITYKSTFSLQPLLDIHFKSEGLDSDRNANEGNIAYIYIFSIIGFFILLIACINYMNLATARSGSYGKEVGIRKVVGAGRQSLIGRFFAESLIMSLVGFIIALNLVSLALPGFNAFTGKAVSLNFFSQSYLLPLLLGIVLLVSFLAGSYPSLYLSRFNPAFVLKGMKKRQDGKISLRKSLVVFQFVLSTIMIIGTLVAFSQLEYIQTKDLGFNKDQMVVVDINSGAVRAGYNTIKEGYAQLASVKNVTVSSRVPGEWKVLPQIDIRLANQADQPGKKTFFIGADEDFLQTFDIELLQGRNFDANRPADSTSIIINEQAAKLLGITQPGEQEYTVPTRIFNGTERPLRQPFRAKVIGIVSDFHFQSLHEKIEPLVIGYRNNTVHSIDYFTVRISGQEADQTIAQLTEVLHGVDPSHIFEYHFLDDQLNLFYETDRRRSQLFTMAAIFAIFIACLGLFGLAAFTAEQRTKEIGIRKILGASVSNLVGLLSKDFLKLVGIALVIAAPIAWYIAIQWLGSFAYSIGFQWWMVLLPGVAAILIALITVSFQSIKVALSNPVKALRYE